jgi:DNA-binding transcriptional LysR family regulator
MRMRHEYLATRPMDLYAMHVFELVATLGGFTRAAEVVGLSQSAVTRQIQTLEDKLGVPLFERTTRKVVLTLAGRSLLAEARKLNGNLEDLLVRFRSEHVEGAKRVRVGFSRTIGLATLPGFLAPFHRRAPEVRLQVSHEGSGELLAALLDHRLDIAVVSAPKRLNPSLEVRHRFTDEFELIVSANDEPPPGKTPIAPSRLRAWAQRRSWILLDTASNTGGNLAHWIRDVGWQASAVMELDNFEVIIHLVAMGLGASLVPRRALAAYPRKHALIRVPLSKRFTREIIMVTRRGHALQKHVRDLIDGVLFS